MDSHNGNSNQQMSLINNKPKPFLKWAGGKSQLLDEIRKFYPFSDGFNKYAEPFLGGGAVFFDVISTFDLEAAFISDINSELINTYIVIRDNVFDLLNQLEKIQTKYCELENEEKKEFYLSIRNDFNDIKINKKKHKEIELASFLIFLNRTCFNGLYRVNSRGEFNVPMGSYKKPLICDEDNLIAVSRSLANVIIKNADYRESINFVDNKTFVYFDPPYRPLNTTSSFNSYSEFEFNDNEQIQLAEYIESVKSKGCRVLLSNSDPKNIDESDHFFDDLYSKNKISRVKAYRMINSKAKNRGPVNELLISNS
ncbi:DNA adenine methylase [Taylorella asinigenitalis 14/45]|uniref:Site-specific DNA-methyltransferase (adenine-specific) n=1 Tax=Taylorella asinigenitalis 14/45 TaxID=1091495 RepID=I7JRL3_9BURK|nr:Dam family site-specific DNA-(adenine-N6)-methyltransferase [Taylorella asinigenitalis]CCG19625.1 DNA adenine methylase [Taylorella asinigenitalis 14/45]